MKSRDLLWFLGLAVAAAVMTPQPASAALYTSTLTDPALVVGGAGVPVDPTGGATVSKFGAGVGASAGSDAALMAAFNASANYQSLQNWNNNNTTTDEPGAASGTLGKAPISTAGFARQLNIYFPSTAGLPAIQLTPTIGAGDAGGDFIGKSGMNMIQATSSHASRVTSLNASGAGDGYTLQTQNTGSSAANAQLVVTINFGAYDGTTFTANATPVSAAGFTLGNLQGGVVFDVKFEDAAGSVLNEQTLTASSGAAGFIGYQSGANDIAQIVLTRDANGQGSATVGLDDLGFTVAAVPEPASLGMLGLGALGLLVRRRR